MEPLKKLKNWVVWKAEKRSGAMTKIPYSINGTKASSTNSSTWATYEGVKEVSKKYSGIGFVLDPTSNLLFIDLDKCLDALPQNFAELIVEANTYTEISPSGNGLHLVFKIEGELNLTANRSSKCPHFECYNTGRYMTVSENVYKEYDTIRTIPSSEALELLRIVGYPWKVLTEVEAPVIVSSAIDTSTMLQRMFESKNGNKIKRLYDGDTDAYGKDESSADMALCMHLAFWFQKDADTIDRTWLQSPLGARSKTQKRKDYRSRTIQAAIEKTTEVYTTPAQILKEYTGLDIRFQTNAKDVPYVNANNIGIIIQNDNSLKNAFRYNEFIGTEESSFGSGHIWTPFEKHHINNVMIHIQKTYPCFERVTATIVEQGILHRLYQCIVNEPKDFILNLEWDGEHRLNHWLSVVFGCEDDVYHSAVGANWLKGLVQRILEPGCKFDYVLVLTGEQGYRKTTAMRILGNGYHTETALDVSNKDFYLLLLRNTIIEFSEGETMSRSDIKHLKAVITTQEDQIRKPYGRNTAVYPRHCVFAMTTNQSQFLKDETGNRRFLPVQVTMVADTKWLEENLKQLYAEAYHRVITLGETTWEFPEQETLQKQEERMVEDPYAGQILDWYAGLSHQQRDNGITTLQAYQAVYQQGSPLGREMHRGQAMVLGSQLRSVLFLERMKGTTGNREWKYYPTEKTNALVPIPSEYAYNEQPF